MVASQSRGQNGFTIIETLMVLAAGGLIMMIIFQAIPNLQRNSRNNQRKQDVSSILGAVSHYALNNSGGMPGPCGGASDPEDCFVSGQPLSGVKLAYYFKDDATDVSVVIKPLSVSDSVPANPDSKDKVGVYNRLHCKNDGSGEATSAAAGFRDVVALYAVEGSGTNRTKQCQEL